MKNDYLWDKTGKDPEIEKLENALRGFRLQKTAPPALATRILPFKKEPARKIFSFALAAACLMFAVTALGIWLQISRNRTQVAGELAEIIAPQNNSDFSLQPNFAGTKDSIIKKQKNVKAGEAEIPKRISKQKIAPVGKSAPAVLSRKETTAKNDRAAGQNLKSLPQNARLTGEEQYAYDRLMLALSITSSKLKLVRDKVQGIEEQNSNLENGR